MSEDGESLYSQQFRVFDSISGIYHKCDVHIRPDCVLTDFDSMPLRRINQLWIGVSPSNVDTIGSLKKLQRTLSLIHRGPSFEGDSQSDIRQSIEIQDLEKHGKHLDRFISHLLARMGTLNRIPDTPLRELLDQRKQLSEDSEEQGICVKFIRKPHGSQKNINEADNTKTMSVSKGFRKLMNEEIRTWNDQDYHSHCKKQTQSHIQGGFHNSSLDYRELSRIRKNRWRVVIHLANEWIIPAILEVSETSLSIRASHQYDSGSQSSYISILECATTEIISISINRRFSQSGVTMAEFTIEETLENVAGFDLEMRRMDEPIHHLLLTIEQNIRQFGFVSASLDNPRGFHSSQLFFQAMLSYHRQPATFLFQFAEQIQQRLSMVGVGGSDDFFTMIQHSEQGGGPDELSGESSTILEYTPQGSSQGRDAVSEVSGMHSWMFQRVIQSSNGMDATLQCELRLTDVCIDVKMIIDDVDWENHFSDLHFPDLQTISLSDLISMQITQDESESEGEYRDLIIRCSDEGFDVIIRSDIYDDHLCDFISEVCTHLIRYHRTQITLELDNGTSTVIDEIINHEDSEDDGSESLLSEHFTHIRKLNFDIKEQPISEESERDISVESYHTPSVDESAASKESSQSRVISEKNNQHSSEMGGDPSQSLSNMFHEWRKRYRSEHPSSDDLRLVDRLIALTQEMVDSSGDQAMSEAERTYVWKSIEWIMRSPLSDCDRQTILHALRDPGHPRHSSLLSDASEDSKQARKSGCTMARVSDAQGRSWETSVSFGLGYILVGHTVHYRREIHIGKDSIHLPYSQQTLHLDLSDPSVKKGMLRTQMIQSNHHSRHGSSSLRKGCYLRNYQFHSDEHLSDLATRMRRIQNEIKWLKWGIIR